ncbi:receptor-like cytosolic serine/threonine-protein kinase RBK2 [Durio zibethinus]|uniref:non-specific serine/threonine protein kinase n=1 Tax=Durio zibethinus TaxID=66656 RepID=A0A6P6B1P6_DURZI|nr:receptor-like cytosolic serine/threonine-protein kinase RBK2 [Durio zibethinus]XP_022771061.1 receptor-like cytosolic serine/threonine-protein kinase RBK2 [Durio zibethinus]XP_022771062.1 receptor-like cytosolic serine/threonine-protein kinase RBK2 [Durio zibethinus]XP_022771063.1 receptor-like cytosolic serine/threonine-protein kinase RBK2 [Durio zibethinus]XP_022771064.1 receptor-like cytosolic serine/threonine-protein kinase RBK2 [Durio zibethinus]
MEKKMDTCSLNGVLEDFFRSEEFETSYSSKAPTTDTKQNSKQGFRWRGFAQLFRSRSKKSLANLQSLGSFRLSLRRSSSMRENVAVAPDFVAKSNSWKVFSLSELQIFTKNFSSENLIGKGGYAEVYKGTLPNGQLVAIKRLTKGTPDGIIGDFLSELGIMAHVNHPNTAKLIGYGIEGGMHLVLELSPYGSLASFLYGSKDKLKWGIRFKIALGTAEGLRYLHEGCKRRIIHRDIKAANILLTKDFEPQICDFGLAKWLPEHWTHHTVSKFEGTFGYLAPEYLMHGIVDEKTDVFAFGVLLLELVTGRRALDYSQQSLLLWAKPLLKKNDIRELIDPYLGEDYNTRQMNLVLWVASLCILTSSIRRPQMSEVVQVLNGNPNSLKSMRKCRIPFFRKAFHEEIFNAEDLSSTRS